MGNYIILRIKEKYLGQAYLVNYIYNETSCQQKNKQKNFQKASLYRFSENF